MFFLPAFLFVRRFPAPQMRPSRPCRCFATLKRMKILVSAIAAALIVFGGAVNSISTPAAVIRKLEARYHHAQTLKAAFYERYSDSSSAGEGSAESGTVYFSQPGRMRWEYESPEKKFFIVDGTNVWFYVPADRTVSRAKVKDSSDWRTPLALLTGKSDLSRLCRTLEIVDAAKDENPEDRPTSAQNTVLRCVPKRD